MSRIRLMVAVIAMLMVGLVWSSDASAQQDGQRRGGFGQGQGQGQGRGGFGGNFDPEQFRAQQMERYKTQLGADNDEWGVIEPRLAKVMEVQRQGGGGGGAFGFGRGGRGGAGFGGPGGGGRRGGGGAFGGGEPSPIAVKTGALMEVLQNEDASNSEIESALNELRDARENHEKELAAAREDLRAVLTLRQEATLVGMSMLD